MDNQYLTFETKEDLANAVTEAAVLEITRVKMEKADVYFGLVICTSFITMYGESDGGSASLHQ
jgi:hypothetical protein